MLRFNQLLILIEFCFSNYPVSLLLVSFPYKILNPLCSYLSLSFICPQISFRYFYIKLFYFNALLNVFVVCIASVSRI